jgi:hypothetical protein
MKLEHKEADWIQAVNYDQWKKVSYNRHHQLYQKIMAKAYDKKVRPKTFQEGDLVLRKILHLPGED